VIDLSSSVVMSGTALRLTADVLLSFLKPEQKRRKGVQGRGGGTWGRPYASPFAQDRVREEGFFQKIRVQSGRETFLGYAQWRRVRLQQRQAQAT
jgi:hypothetical protein